MATLKVYVLGVPDQFYDREKALREKITRMIPDILRLGVAAADIEVIFLVDRRETWRESQITVQATWITDQPLSAMEARLYLANRLTDAVAAYFPQAKITTWIDQVNQGEVVCRLPQSGENQ